MDKSFRSVQILSNADVFAVEDSSSGMSEAKKKLSENHVNLYTQELMYAYVYLCICAILYSVSVVRKGLFVQGVFIENILLKCDINMSENRLDLMEN